MRGCETGDQFLSLGSKGEEDLAAVVRRDLSNDGSTGDELVDNADGAVVTDLKLLGEVADGELLLI